MEHFCTGCSACSAVCPNDSIEMLESKDGFLIPSITSNCNECGLCYEVCPIICCQNDYPIYPTRLMAAWSNNDDIVYSSSSGGIFYEVAKYIIEMGGQTIGCIFDKNRSKHVITNQISIIDNMKGSKYIQSRTYDAFYQLYHSADTPFTLFTGTPCQVAALKKIWRLAGKNDEKLMTADVICRGVPSFLLYDLYVVYLEKGKSIRHISFREKSKGWENFSLLVVFDDGSTRKKQYKNDIFMKCYLSSLPLRMSCYNCNFNRLPRLGDITLGDFWGAPQSIKNPNGTSALLINSQKGQEVIDRLRQSDRITAIQRDLHEAIHHNNRIVSGYVEIPAIRKRFLKALKSRRLLIGYYRDVALKINIERCQNLLFNLSSIILKALNWNK